MKIIKRSISDLTNEETREIKSFLEKHCSTIFHEPEFNEIVKEAFQTKFRFKLVYNTAGELIALCPLHTEKVGLLQKTYSNPKSYELPYGGWIYNRNKISLPALLKKGKPSFNEAFTCVSLPILQDDEYLKIEHKAQYQTAVIDLEQSIEEIWQVSINPKKRNKIRKARKHNIMVEKLDQSGIDAFMHLKEETYEATVLSIKPKNYYENILKTYYPQNKAVILLAKKGPELLSGIFLLRNRYFCHYWLSARKKESDNLGQGEMLQWEAIKWAAQAGSRFYDLCVVEPDKLPHVAEFKLGFSKNTVPFYLLSQRRWSYRIMTRIQNAF